MARWKKEPQLDSVWCLWEINRQQIMKGRHRERQQGGDSQMTLFSLQKNLLQVWESLNVDEYYQNLILAHLDSLPGQEAQSVIAKEIKATHEGSSPYFKLAERLRSRKKELAALSSLVGGEAGGEELAEITQLLGELRDHNLAVAQMLIGLHRDYSGDGSGVSDQCMQMLQSLDSDNDFLKESFLSQFMLFQQGYDPFFLYHYDMRAKKSTPQQHPLIDQLFNLSISYACRLFKAKNKALEMLTEGKYKESKTFKRRSKSYGRRGETISSPLSTPTNEQDTKRSTNTNFHVRKVLSLGKAKERERMQTIDSSPQDSPTRQPLLNRQKLGLMTQEQPSDEYEQEEEAYQLVPVRYRVKKSLPRSQFLQQIRKQTAPVEQEEEPQMKYSLNFKEKLEPLNRRPSDEDPSNRSSIFKRATIRDPLARPLILSKQEQLPLSLKSSGVKPGVEEQIKTSNGSQGSQGKEIKMRPGKVAIQEMGKYLRQLDNTSQLKNETILNSRFEESLRKCQAYLSELLMGGQLKAVGVCFALPDGDYLVKLWAPLRSCDEETSHLLLRKYLEYLQRQSSCNNIYYGGNSKSLFLSLDFQPKNEKLLARRRTAPMPTRRPQFPQFFSLKCSNIMFQQENKATKILYSDEIQAFSPTNHYILPAFAAANRNELPGGAQMAVKVSQDIVDMKALNSLLEDQQLDTYQVASSLRISQITAIRLAAQFNFRSSFLAGEGSFRLNGEQLLRKGKALVLRVQIAQLGGSLLLGKGLGSIGAFVQAAKQGQGEKKACEAAVRMFSKQLYGRIPGAGGQACSYGNWEFSLSWQDELQGRVRHNLSNMESFGPEPFFCGVEVERQLFFAFEVTAEDFLF